MQLLGVRVARAIWLFPPYFLNPRGAFLRPVVEAVKAKYSFLKSPLDAPIPPPTNAGYRYENGAFEGKNGVVEIISMVRHDDGIVIDTRSSTDDADSFLEDLISWASKEYGLPSISELPIRRIYASELNVLFARTPMFFNPKLAPFLEQVSSSIGEDSKIKAGFLGLSLGTDERTASGVRSFKLEREANTLIEENRYWSFSPTTTEVHLDLLGKLEELAT